MQKLGWIIALLIILISIYYLFLKARAFDKNYPNPLDGVQIKEK